MIALVAAAAAALGGGAAAPAEDGRPSAEQVAERRTALREARTLWRARPLRNYTYRVQRLCFCPSTNQIKITVRGGRPRGTPKGYRDVDTVGDLFRKVESLVTSHKLEVRYSRRGCPCASTRIRSSWRSTTRSPTW